MNEKMKELLIAALIACLLALVLPEAQAQESISAQVVELVDTRDLKSLSDSYEGSNPSLGTNRLWITVPMRSWHNGDKPYNENNLGFGIQYDFNNNWSVMTVRYPNSFDTWTTAIGFPYSPSWSHWEYGKLLVKPGVAFTFFKGYDGDKWELVPVPNMDIIWNRTWGFNFITDLDSFVGFSLKLNTGVFE